MLYKRRQQDWKDREYDSDDDLKKQMMTYDDRLTFVNELDHKVFGSPINPKDADAPKKSKTSSKTTSAAAVVNTGAAPEEQETTQQQLPIVLHEREIMENIENFLVTIVCGETGSGKSTQIPQFIYEAAKSNPWKFKNNAQNGGPPLLVGIT